MLTERSLRRYTVQQALLKELAANYAIVPEVWAFEIANTIFVSYKRRKRINERQVREYLEFIYSLPISVAPRGLRENVDLYSFACAHNISAYDAAYLDLAQRTGFPLATSDVDLRDCATRLSIPLFS